MTEVVLIDLDYFNAHRHRFTANHVATFRYFRVIRIHSIHFYQSNKGGTREIFVHKQKNGDSTWLGNFI
jgi:hypothetical protein